MSPRVVARRLGSRALASRRGPSPLALLLPTRRRVDRRARAATASENATRRRGLPRRLVAWVRSAGLDPVCVHWGRKGAQVDTPAPTIRIGPCWASGAPANAMAPIPSAASPPSTARLVSRIVPVLHPSRGATAAPAGIVYREGGTTRQGGAGGPPETHSRSGRVRAGVPPVRAMGSPPHAAEPRSGLKLNPGVGMRRRKDRLAGQPAPPAKAKRGAVDGHRVSRMSRSGVRQIAVGAAAASRALTSASWRARSSAPFTLSSRSTSSITARGALSP